jgi:hypothetical protein
MTALASIADYTAITGRTVADGDETTRIERLLELASDAILAGAHGQTITTGTTTDLTCRPYDGVIYLPQRPVTAVTAVSIDGVDYASDAYRFTPGGDRRPAMLLRRSNGRDVPWPDCVEVQVTYDHGWDPIPGQIIAATVAMASAVVRNAGGPARIQEGTGPFTAGFATFDLQSSTMNLSGPTRSLLDQLCGVTVPASVPIGRRDDGR